MKRKTPEHIVVIKKIHLKKKCLASHLRCENLNKIFQDLGSVNLGTCLFPMPFERKSYYSLLKLLKAIYLLACVCFQNEGGQELRQVTGAHPIVWHKPVVGSSR